jgi:hypothetical protein
VSDNAASTFHRDRIDLRVSQTADRLLPPAVAVVLAVAMTWPLVLHLGGDVGQDLGDPLLEVWQVAWIGHALLHQPLHLFQANIYWPLRDSLAFSDALVGYGPAGLIAAQGPTAALVVYNLLLLFAYALAFLGAYLLGRELGLGRLGALAAGVAFAYAPWRLAQNGHLHVLSSGGIPLSLFLLVRGYRRRSGRLILGGWLVAAWQLTLGFTLGLQLAYLLAVLGVICGAWVVRRRPEPARRVVATTAAGVMVFVVAALLQARPYLRVSHDHPESKRTPALVSFFSPSPKAFLAAPRQSLVWGSATASVRRQLSWPVEQTLFPGATIAALALLGLLGRVWSRRLRLGLAAGVAICAALSLGLREPQTTTSHVLPYRLLYDFGPGWDGVRVPGRLNTLTSLGLALLAGAGLCVVLRRVTRSRVRLAATTVFVGAMLVEGFGPLPHPTVPKAPSALRLATPPLLDLPTGPDVVYEYWSTDGFPKIVNGSGSFEPSLTERLYARIAGFPDRRSVAALRSLGVHTVAFDPDLAAGTPWQEVLRRPVRGLPLERRRVGRLVLFELNG